MDPDDSVGGHQRSQGLIGLATKRTILTLIPAWISHCIRYNDDYPDSKVHGANVGPTWVRPAPGVPHFGPTNFDIGVLPVKSGHWCSRGTSNSASWYDTSQGSHTGVTPHDQAGITVKSLI